MTEPYGSMNGNGHRHMYRDEEGRSMDFWAPSLHERVALITGGGTGIGRATALALTRRGAAIAIAYAHSEADALSTVRDIYEIGGRAVAVRADVRNDREVRAMVQRVVDELGAVDVLVNNASVTESIPLADLEAVTEDDWTTLFATNVKGMFYCARAVAPQMRARGEGAIVNLGSIAGLTGDGSSLPYAVTKAATIGLTKSLARALAPEIRVNCVAPGVVATRWWKGREELATRLSMQTVLGRLTTAEDVAALICAVLEQRTMTGQVLTVDGGQTL